MIELRQGVYVIGGGLPGHNESATKRSSEFLATGSSVWIKGPDIPGEGVRSSCVAKVSDTEFVILGGQDDRKQARVYNEETEEWREWPRLTNEVYGQSCVGLEDIVLMAGGRELEYTGRTVIFDTKTGSAREVRGTTLKYPRGFAPMVLYGGRPLILGGFESPEGGWSGDVRSDGEIWNMDMETWEKADINLNIARSDFALVPVAEELDCK